MSTDKANKAASSVDTLICLSFRIWAMEVGRSEERKALMSINRNRFSIYRKSFVRGYENLEPEAFNIHAPTIFFPFDKILLNYFFFAL